MSKIHERPSDGHDNTGNCPRQGLRATLRGAVARILELDFFGSGMAPRPPQWIGSGGLHMIGARAADLGSHAETPDGLDGDQGGNTIPGPDQGGFEGQALNSAGQDEYPLNSDVQEGQQGPLQ